MGESFAVVCLSKQDLNIIKTGAYGFNSVANTFLAIEDIRDSDFVDVAGNSLITIPLNNALPVSEVVEDTTLPSLLHVVLQPGLNNWLE